MNLVRNERIKLLATALNNSAVATVATAIIAPMAGFLYGSSPIAGSRWGITELGLVIGWVKLTYSCTARARET
jgi:hypothetical protein